MKADARLTSVKQLRQDNCDVRFLCSADIAAYGSFATAVCRRWLTFLSARATSLPPCSSVQTMPCRHSRWRCHAGGLDTSLLAIVRRDAPGSAPDIFSP